MPWFHWDGEDLILHVKVQARASRDEFAGTIDEYLKVRITAAPVEGRANTHLIRFLAHRFDIPRTSITLVQGHKGKTKVLRLKVPAKLPPELGIPIPKR